MPAFDPSIAAAWPLDSLVHNVLSNDDTYVCVTPDVSGNTHSASGSQLRVRRLRVELEYDEAFGNVLSFSGNNPLQAAPDNMENAFANGSDRFSVCGWIYPHRRDDGNDGISFVNQKGVQGAFFSYGSAGQLSLCVGYAPSGVQVYLLDNHGENLYEASVRGALPEGWYFVSVTYGAAGIRISLRSFSQHVEVFHPFADGVARLTASADAAVVLGGDPWGEAFFQGKMSRFALFRKTLSGEDLIELHQHTLLPPLRMFLPLSHFNLQSTPDLARRSGMAFLVGNPPPAIVPDSMLGAVAQFSGSNYLSLDEFQYSYQGEITRITVAFWLKTTVPEAGQTIACFGKISFWQIKVETDGTLGWLTTDRYGTTDSLHSVTAVADGTWHYVTVQYEAGTGTKTIFLNSRQDVIRDNALAGQPLGKFSTVRYGTIGVDSNASQPGGAPGTEFFVGSLAQFRLYHSLLSVSQIQELMRQSVPPGVNSPVVEPLGYAIACTTNAGLLSGSLCTYAHAPEAVTTIAITNRTNAPLPLEPYLLTITLNFPPGALDSSHWDLFRINGGTWSAVSGGSPLLIGSGNGYYGTYPDSDYIELISTSCTIEAGATSEVQVSGVYVNPTWTGDTIRVEVKAEWHRQYYMYDLWYDPTRFDELLVAVVR